MTAEEFLDTGLLEQYVLGLLDSSQVKEVQQYIDRFPEVKAEFDSMQDSIHRLADSYSIAPPPSIKKQVVSQISPPSSSSSSAGLAKYAFATFALVSLLMAFFAYQRLERLEQELSDKHLAYASLKEKCEQSQQSLTEKVTFYAHEATELQSLKGNSLASNFNAKAYYNKPQATYLVEVASYPDLPTSKCLVLWGDLEGKMIKLGKIGPKSSVFNSFDPKMDSFNVTIEESADVDHPDVSQLIASITI